MLKQGKRGQGLSTNAIVLIVLAVVVLVVLILGFTVGWEQLSPWISNDNNVDSIATSCSVACSTESVYEFCTLERELVAEGDTVAEGVTCFDLSNQTEYAQYGIAECPSLVSECEEIANQGA